MTISNDWTNKRLKIQQEIEKSQAFKSGVNQGMQIHLAGAGGSPGQPYTPPKEDPKNPYVPAPSRQKLAHGEGRGPQPKYHDEYNRPIKGRKPWEQMFPDGTLREIPWQKKEYLEKHPELMISQGPDYIGDKLRYGQLDRILNPFNDFRKPTLDQLRIHSKAYPKAV